jgi:hypothetical protein
MGIPEWMLSIDNRKTKILHNGACIQFLLHFKGKRSVLYDINKILNYIFLFYVRYGFIYLGPIANKLEQDFSKLISIGKLEAPSLYIPGYIPTKRKSTLGHRQCGVRDPNDKSNFIYNSCDINREYLLTK